MLSVMRILFLYCSRAFVMCTSFRSGGIVGARLERSDQAQLVVGLACKLLSVGAQRAQLTLERRGRALLLRRTKEQYVILKRNLVDA